MMMTIITTSGFLARYRMWTSLYHCSTALLCYSKVIFSCAFQSINQLHFYCANIPSRSQAQWRTSQVSVQKQKSKLQSEKENRQQAIGCAGIYGGEAK